MKTSDSEANDRRCPKCGAPVARDLKGRGFARHREHLGDCKKRPYGKGERDWASASAPSPASVTDLNNSRFIHTRDSPKLF